MIRQIHHWAALVFVASICLHILRIFFSGAFRKPREINWVIGTTLFLLACVEGFCGYSLPDDLLSGTGIRIAEGIMLSIPIVGTYVAFFFFSGQYPGHIFVSRLYITHVLLIPGDGQRAATAYLVESRPPTDEERAVMQTRRPDELITPIPATSCRSRHHAARSRRYGPG